MAKNTAGWSIVLSSVMIVAGLVALILPWAAGVTVVVLVGWLMIFSGMVHLIFAWDIRNSDGVVWELLLGIVYIVVGVYLLSHISAVLLGITVAIGIYLLLEAILEFVLAYRLSPLPGSGWLMFDGVVTLLLAILMWRAWSTPWALGVLVGISMLFSGVSRLMLSLAAGRVLTRLP